MQNDKITIISPSTANSNLVHGTYFDGVNFLNKYNDILKHTWVVFCYWSEKNSKFGSDVADVQTKLFCQKYSIENKMY
jgi:hypothetical protein